MISAVLGTCSN